MSSDPKADAELATTLANARKAVAEASSAESAAAAAKLKTAIGEPPAGPFTGSVTTGDGAGTAELNLLARRGLEAIADQIVETMKGLLKDNQSVLVSAADPVAPFAHVEALDGRLKLIETAAEGALALSNKIHSPVPTPTGKFSVIAETLGAAGLVLSGINALLGYIRTDYAISGSTLTPAGRVLVIAVAKRLMKLHRGVAIDGIYAAASEKQRTNLQDRIETLSRTVADLRLRAAQHEAAIGKAKKAADQAPSVPSGKAQKPAPTASGPKPSTSGDEQALAACQSVIALFDKMSGELFGDASGTTLLARVAQEATLREFLGENAILLTLKIDGAWGSAVSHKNLSTSLFHELPYEVSASVGASWAAFDCDSGNLIAADLATYRAPLTHLVEVR